MFWRAKKVDKTAAGYVATEKEMAQHSYDVAKKELDKSIQMWLKFKMDSDMGTATNGQLLQLQYQQGLADFYMRNVDFAKLIF